MNLKLMFDRIKNILTTFVLLALSSFCISCSEVKHQTIEKGTSVEDALETLDKFGYAHGTQEYGLAWQPTNDEAFIFCKLDTDKTLVLVHKSTLIEELIVVVPPGTTASDLKGQKNRQRPTITPTSIHFLKILTLSTLINNFFYASNYFYSRLSFRDFCACPLAAS